MFTVYASVNSTCTQHPPPPWVTPKHWHFFANPQGGDEKRGQMPRPPSTLQHFSLIAQSNSAILSILMCDFLFQYY